VEGYVDHAGVRIRDDRDAGGRHARWNGDRQRFAELAGRAAISTDGVDVVDENREPVTERLVVAAVLDSDRERVAVRHTAEEVRMQREFPRPALRSIDGARDVALACTDRACRYDHREERAERRDARDRAPHTESLHEAPPTEHAVAVVKHRNLARRDRAYRFC